jgi:ABC-type transporter Mla subunit MlaD
MTERGMRIWIGAFTLGSMVLLGWLIILFGTAPNLFKSTWQYTFRFPDAQGINPGSPVRRSGVRIGEVRDVVLDDEAGDVKVLVALDKRFTLRHSDDAVVVTGLLGGDSSIEIVPRQPPEEGQPPLDRSPVPPGTEVKGLRQPTFNMVLNQASGMVPTAQETLNDIRKSVQRLEKFLPVFEEAVKEYQGLAKDLRGLTPGARQTLEDIQEITKEARKAVPTFTRTAEDIQQLARAVREAVPDGRTALKQAGELLEVTRKAVPNLVKTFDEFRDLSQEARTKALPSLTKTSDEVRELVKEVRGIPGEARKTLEEFGATARTWGKVGERLNVLVEANQDKVVKALDNINDVLMRLAGTLSDANQTNLSEFLRNTRAASGNFESISRNVDEITREGRKTVPRLNSALEKADGFLKDLQGATNQQGGRIGSITRNLDESLQKLNSALDDLRVMVRTIGQADGTISRLLTDPSLFNKIDQALCSLPGIMARAERIVKSFEVFADKLARHPEAIGLGGVVRPGNGINDASPGHNTSYYPPAPQGPTPPVGPRR